MGVKGHLEVLLYFFWIISQWESIQALIVSLCNNFFLAAFKKGQSVGDIQYYIGLIYTTVIQQ